MSSPTSLKSTPSSETSPNGTKYQKDAKQLSELSRRGLVMKSPFFQMEEQNNSSTPGKRTPVVFKRKTSWGARDELSSSSPDKKEAKQEISKAIPQQHAESPSPNLTDSCKEEEEKNQMTVLKEKKKGLGLNLQYPESTSPNESPELADEEAKNFIFTTTTSTITGPSPIIEVDETEDDEDDAGEDDQDRDTDYSNSPASRSITTSVSSFSAEQPANQKPLPKVPMPTPPPTATSGEFPLHSQDTPTNNNDDLESIATVDTSIVEDEAQSIIQDPDLTPVPKPTASMSASNLTPQVTNNGSFPLDPSALEREHEPLKLSTTASIPRLRTASEKTTTSTSPVHEDMSRQSVLDAFENDIRNLLLLEQQKSTTPTTNNNDNFEQKMDTLYQELDSESRNGSRATSFLEDNEERARELRNSRSTLSSYGGYEVSELDPEDPKSQVPASPVRSPQRSKRYSSTASNLNDNIEIYRHRSFSSRTSYYNQTEEIHHYHYPKHRQSTRLNSNDSTQHQLQSKPSKRGRLSLRRKSAATLRLSSLGTATTAVRDESIPPTPPTPSTLQLLAVTFDPFLNSRDINHAMAADVPSNPKQIALWFLRQVLASKSNSAGAFLSEKIYVPSDLWNLDTISPKLLEPRLKCLNDLTKIGSEYLHMTNTQRLEGELRELETTFNMAFITPLNESLHQPQIPPAPRRASTSTSLGINPVSSGTQSMPSSRNGSVVNANSGSVFRRLRKKSIIGTNGDHHHHHNQHHHISGPISEPQTPTDLIMHRLTLDHYLSSISSLAASLESIQQQFNETQCGGEWLSKYRTFIGHTACRLILKDITSLQDIYKNDFREYLLK